MDRQLRAMRQKGIGDERIYIDRASGIPYSVRLYDFRHMFATLMLANGADLAAVSKLMGHASVKMTADTYYQYLEGEKERAVSLLPDLPLYPAQAGQQGLAGA